MRLSGAIAIAVIVCVVVAWIVLHFSTANGNAQAQEDLIRKTVDESGVAADFQLTKVSEGQAGYQLDVTLLKEADPTDTGELLHTLYGDIESVTKVDLGFAENHELDTSRIERSTEEWSELVTHVDGIGPVVASFSQVGPTGAATYWLDLQSFAADPATEYERLQAVQRPEWLTYGNVELTTAPDSWPSLIIQAGRDVTADELSTFRALDDELAATVKAGEHYELKMLVELGADAAEFEMRIVTEPLHHTSESPAPEESTDSAQPPADDSRPKDSGDSDSSSGSSDGSSEEEHQSAPDSSTGGSDGDVEEPGAPAEPAPEPTTPPQETTQPAPSDPNGERPTDTPTDPENKPDTGPNNELRPNNPDGSNSTTPDVADPSTRTDAISHTLSERSELILDESGLSAFVLTIKIDDADPLRITG